MKNSPLSVTLTWGMQKQPFRVITAIFHMLHTFLQL